MHPLGSHCLPLAVALLRRRQIAWGWIKGSSSVMWIWKYRRTVCLCHARGLHLVPQSLGSKVAQPWSGLGLARGPSSILSETWGVFLQKCSPKATCIQTGGSWSVISLLVGTEDIGAQAFCQVGPGSVCKRLQGTTKKSVILIGIHAMQTVLANVDSLFWASPGFLNRISELHLGVLLGTACYSLAASLNQF